MGLFDFLMDAFEDNAKRTTKRLSEKSGDDSIYNDWESGREERENFRSSIKELLNIDDDN